MDIIKKCPFCRSARVEGITKTSAGAGGAVKHSYYVKCHNCYARGPMFVGSEKHSKEWRDLAVHEWNKAARDFPAEV
jgi:transposase-like protein